MPILVVLGLLYVGVFFFYLGFAWYRSNVPLPVAKKPVCRKLFHHVNHNKVQNNQEALILSGYIIQGLNSDLSHFPLSDVISLPHNTIVCLRQSSVLDAGLLRSSQKVLASASNSAEIETDTKRWYSDCATLKFKLSAVVRQLMSFPAWCLNGSPI
jgi:hypothetical protein